MIHSTIPLCRHRRRFVAGRWLNFDGVACVDQKRPQQSARYL